MARPTKLLPKTVDELARALSVGASVATACACAGISTSLFYSWKSRGEREKKRIGRRQSQALTLSERPFLEFLDTVTQAELQAELRALSRIQLAAFGEKGVLSKRIVSHEPLKVGGQLQRDENGDVIYSSSETVTYIDRRPDWRAAAWFLERRFAERWGRRRWKVQAEASVEPVGMTLDEWNKIRQKHLQELDVGHKANTSEAEPRQTLSDNDT